MPNYAGIVEGGRVSQDWICTIADALKSVTVARFFKSERGFQSQFHVALDKLFTNRGLVSNQAIIEEEYQKTIPNHGISHRPDLIVHIPFEARLTGSRREGNFVAFEFKIRGSRLDAIDRFIKLNDYLTMLAYPLGVFINIDDTRSFVELIPDYRIQVFTVVKDQETVRVSHSYLEDEQPVVNEF
jgi:hypothetical protein